MKHIVMRAVGSFCSWLLLTAVFGAEASSIGMTELQEHNMTIGVAVIAAAIVGLAQVAWYFMCEEKKP